MGIGIILLGIVVVIAIAIIARGDFVFMGLIAN